MSSFHSDDGNAVSNGFCPSAPSSPPPPALSPRNQRSSPPPPIPPKSSFSILAPHTPVASSDFGTLKGSQEDISEFQCPDSSPGYFSNSAPSDNYSVPLTLKQLPRHSSPH